MSSILLILHVLTAVFIVGPMAILPMTGLRALRAGDPDRVRGLARSAALFSWLSLVTFVLGFGVAGMWKLSMTTPWVLWSVILYVVAFVLSVFVAVPAMRTAADRIAAGSDAAARPAYGRIAASNGVAALLLVVVVVLMAWRP